MAKHRTSDQPPRRKEAGVIGKTFSWLMGTIYWLLISLVVSIVIEWIGIFFFWQDQGSDHSAQVLQHDIAHLNTRVTDEAGNISTWIKATTERVNGWIAEQQGIKAWISKTKTGKGESIRKWLRGIYKKFEAYIDAVPNTTQIFFVRMGILILSTPAFFLFGLLGMVDGLVERDLRRWGGGRESSVIYNIARKSLVKLFIATCVIYLSFPKSIEPSWIIIPFAMAFGLSMRITLDKFKKYF